MNRYLAELETELQKNRKTPRKGTDKTDKRAFVSNVSAPIGPFSEKNLPSWCSESCPALIELHTSQGKLTGCRQVFDGHITWTRLSYLEGCLFNVKKWPEW